MAIFAGVGVGVRKGVGVGVGVGVEMSIQLSNKSAIIKLKNKEILKVLKMNFNQLLMFLTYIYDY